MIFSVIVVVVDDVGFFFSLFQVSFGMGCDIVGVGWIDLACIMLDLILSS